MLKMVKTNDTMSGSFSRIMYISKAYLKNGQLKSIFPTSIIHFRTYILLLYNDEKMVDPFSKK